MMKTLLTICAVLILVGSASAAYTGVHYYPEASNCTGSGAWVDPPNSNDNFWSLHDPLYNAPSSLAQWEGEHNPDFTQTISGLDDTKAYDIYVTWIATIIPGAAAWTGGVYAKLSGDSSYTQYTNYDEADSNRDGVTVADYWLYPDTGPDPDEPYLCLFEAKLGQVSGVTSVGVDIQGLNSPADKDVANTSNDQYCRSLYNGLNAFEIPEPATLAVLAVGGLLTLIRRRRS